MSYFQNIDSVGQVKVNGTAGIPVFFGDTASVDAFQRVRVAAPYTQFDWTNQYAPSTFANQQDWDVALVSGTITPVANQCAIRLSTNGTTSTNAATIQTKRHMIYQPGKSRDVFMTFVMGAPQTNATVELGYGDASNGIFLQRIHAGVSTTNYITRRTNASGTPTDNAVDQASWNIDTLDGNGASGITLDFTKTQILVIDLQFLGVGRVRVGFDVAGKVYWAHHFLNANTTLSNVYMSTGSLPLRARVVNTGTSGGTTTLDFVCASVISSGGYEGDRAKQFSISNGSTSVATTNANLVPILSLRPATTFNGVTFRGHIVPSGVNVLVGNAVHRYVLLKNATLGGGTNFVAVDSTYSASQYDVSSTTVSGGIILDTGYIPASGGATARSSAAANLVSDNPFVYTSLGNVQETFTVAAQTLSGNSVAYADLIWQERY